MELSILTNARVLLAIYDQVDMKMTCYKSFKEDTEFNSKKIAVIERFTDEDVSELFLSNCLVLLGV